MEGMQAGHEHIIFCNQMKLLVTPNDVVSPPWKCCCLWSCWAIYGYIACQPSYLTFLQKTDKKYMTLIASILSANKHPTQLSVHTDTLV
jgi:hypothetical protein